MIETERAPRISPEPFTDFDNPWISRVSCRTTVEIEYIDLRGDSTRTIASKLLRVADVTSPIQGTSMFTNIYASNDLTPFFLVRP